MEHELTHEGRFGAAPSALGRRASTFAAMLNREVLWLTVVLAYGFVVLLFGPRLIAQDSWLAFLGGRVVAQDGIPRHETFTVMAAGHSWVDQQWLGQVFWYAVVRIAGLPGALLVNAGALVASLGLVLALARRNGASARSTALVALACIPAAAPNTVLRTQVLAYPLFAAVLWLLLRDARVPSRRVFLALPLLVLWANVHGSVLVGAGLVASYGVVELVRAARGARARARLAVGALLAFAPATVLCTPYGLDIVGYYTSTLGNGAFGEVVSEWQATSFPSDWPYFALAFAGTALLGREARRVAPFELIAFVALLGGGLVATRHVVWFALGAAAILPRALDGAWPAGKEAPRRPRVNAVLLGSLGVLVLGAGVGLAKSPPSAVERGFPRAAADRAASAAGADGRVYASERFADWLLWRHPALAGRIAYDARFELLSADQIRNVALVKSRGPGWLAALQNYRVVVLDPRAEPRAVRGLRETRGFEVVHEDDDAVVFARPS